MYPVDLSTGARVDYDKKRGKYALQPSNFHVKDDTALDAGLCDGRGCPS